MFNTYKVSRALSAAMVSIVVLTLLIACGDSTNTPAAAPAATSASTTAAMSSAATATTAAATTAAAMTSAMASTAAMTTAPATTAAMASTAAATTAAMASTAAMTTAAGTTAAMTSAAATSGATGSTSTSVDCSAGPKIGLKELNFGAIPAENAAKVLDDTKTFAAALSKQLCIPVKVYVGPNYTAVIEALSSGKIDAAIFGPFSYVLAADKYGAKVVALQLGIDGSKSYNSLIITTPATGIKTLADVKGHTFSFVDPASTSGNLIPRYTLTKVGIDPDKDVKGTFAGSHDVSLLGVASGKSEAGAVASDIFAKTVKDGKIKESDVVILAKSDPIPNSPVAVRKDMSDADATIFKNALMAVKDPEALKALNTAGFIENTDANYNTLRDVAKTLGLDLTKLK